MGGLETLREASERIYSPEPGAEAVFSVDRLPTGVGFNTYLLDFHRPLTRDEVDKVVTLAKEDTRRSLQDRVEHEDHFETDTLECEFTHALEHIAVSVALRSNPLASLTIDEFGYTTHGVLRDDPTSHVYYFEVNNSIAPRNDLEVAAVRFASQKVAKMIS